MLDVAITGTGIVSGLGCGSRKFHDAMMAGEIAIREAPWHNGESGRPSWWAIVRVKFPVPSRVAGHYERMRARPSVAKALADEGL